MVAYLTTCVTSKNSKMMEFSTSCYWLNLVWSYPRLVLLSVLMAITLFVVGPQMGSIDDDQDGSPDIAVVVSSPKASDVCRNFHGGQDGIDDGKAVADKLVRTAPFWVSPSSSAPRNGRAVLQAVCVLRC